MSDSLRSSLKLLGGFELRRPDGTLVELPTRKSELLLAYLAVPAGRAHGREKLADLFWGDTQDEQARGSLRNALSALREALGPNIIVADRRIVKLQPDALTVDVALLEAAAGAASEADDAVLTLLRGDFLDGVPSSGSEFDDWLRYERTRYQNLVETALEHAVGRRTQKGESAEAIALAQRLLALDPLREQSHRVLMQAFVAAGERSKALEAYQQLKDLLLRELGTEPSPQTSDFMRESLASQPADVTDAGSEEGTGQGRDRATPHSDQATKPLVLPDKPSIAVLPFTNMSGELDQEYFADGLVEEIITGLGRVRSFFVIARNSSFTYKGRAVDVRQVARELGVRYVLEGSIRKAGSRVRIVGQLVDAVTGHHVWADRFEGELGDIFELQDKVTESVVGAVEPSIRLQEIRQARTKPTSFITAYDLYLRALPGFYSMTREGFAEVRRLTNEALTIDPGFTLAKALGAYVRSLSVSQCWHEPDDVRVAVRMANEVIAEAGDDPTSLRFAAQVLAYSAKDYDRALNAIDRSLQLNPNSAQSYTGGGWVNTHASRPLIAIDHFHRAIRLSPLDPEKGIALSGIGMSFLMLQRFEDALHWGETAIREMPNYGTSHRVVITALVELDRLEEARAAAARMMDVFPTYTLTLQRQINPWRDKIFGERYIRALHTAGVPE